MMDVKLKSLLMKIIVVRVEMYALVELYAYNKNVDVQIMEYHVMEIAHHCKVMHRIVVLVEMFAIIHFLVLEHNVFVQNLMDLPIVMEDVYLWLTVFLIVVLVEMYVLVKHWLDHALMLLVNNAIALI
jgi:hypothetical protein